VRFWPPQQFRTMLRTMMLQASVPSPQRQAPVRLHYAYHHTFSCSLAVSDGLGPKQALSFTTPTAVRAVFRARVRTTKCRSVMVTGIWPTVGSTRTLICGVVPDSSSAVPYQTLTGPPIERP